MQQVFLLHLFATIFMTGLIWMVQIVHYPLMDGVSADLFVEYEARHTKSISFIVLPIMLIELGTAAALVFLPSEFNSKWLLIAFGLIVIIWLSTFFIQVPLHGILSNEFDEKSHQTLVNSNWIRTIAWSIRSIILMYLLASMNK